LLTEVLGFGPADIARLREISELSGEGLSLEGIKRVLALQEEVLHLRGRLAEFHREKSSTSLVVWRPDRRSRGTNS
jgi:MerR family transcriptional regulator/heat shock protein HspR